jgi:hypothetical protein
MAVIISDYRLSKRWLLFFNVMSLLDREVVVFHSWVANGLAQRKSRLIGCGKFIIDWNGFEKLVCLWLLLNPQLKLASQRHKTDILRLLDDILAGEAVIGEDLLNIVEVEDEGVAEGGDEDEDEVTGLPTQMEIWRALAFQKLVLAGPGWIMEIKDMVLTWENHAREGGDD